MESKKIPTDRNGLVDRISGLSPEKRDLLIKRLQSRKIHEKVIPRRSDQTTYPLSFAQERLWFLDQLSPGSSFYSIPIAVNILGVLDKKLLKESLKIVYQRHEVLRSRYVFRDNQLIQEIQNQVDLQLPIIDLRTLSDKEKEEQAKRILNQEARYPFRLNIGPLVRTILIELSDDKSILLVVMHHIVADAWSLKNFIQEAALVYQSLKNGEPVTLPELPIQYADFSAWQREWLANEIFDQQFEYWNRQLKNCPQTVNLPIDRPRPSIQTFEGKHFTFHIYKELSDDLHKLSLQNEATLFMTMLTSFFILISRYSGQEDFCIGTPVSTRKQPELQNLIGFFINTLVIRGDLTGNPSFLDLLKRVVKICLEAFSNQDIPFEMLVERLRTKRSLSSTPFIQILFALQPNPLEFLKVGDLSIHFDEVETASVKFELTLSIDAREDGLLCHVGFSTDVFDEITIQRIFNNYMVLLHGISLNPNGKVMDFPIISEAETKLLLETYKGVTHEKNWDGEIIDQISNQAMVTPNGIAIIELDELNGDPLRSITYSDLDDKVNRLAYFLQGKSKNANKVIGIGIDRSINQIISLLAVLKAGFAYLPLDIKLPQKRLHYILSETKPYALLVDNKHLDIWNEAREIVQNIFSVDDIFNESLLKFPLGVKPAKVNETRRLAYIIFTSGTTGQPKGIQIPLPALTNYINFAADFFGIKKDDRILQFASISFDTAVEEIYTCLIRGATLVLRNDRMLDSAKVFLEVCEKAHITVLDLPTAFFHQLTSEIYRYDYKLPAKIRLIVIGGEKADSSTVHRWVQRNPTSQVRLINTYGPSEATIVSTWWEFPATSISKSEIGFIPIGKPVPNVEVYILDDQLRLVPIGAPGELFIGGIGVAWGYLNHSDQNEKYFINNPFQPGKKKIYRTGDYVRWLNDGNILFLGRIDRQIKVRGFRIEPDEIEYVIKEHPAISDAVVTTFGDNGDDETLKLTGYYVLNQGMQVNVEELKEYLRSKLPEYMLPHYLIQIPTLPKSISGKVDYLQLPSPISQRLVTKEVYQPPQTEIEILLCDLWKEILNIEKIGTRDNFFELGGDSLKAALLINRLQHELDDILFVALLFDAPTIKSLAHTLSIQYPKGVSRWISRRFPENTTVIEDKKGLENLEPVDSSKILTIQKLLGFRESSPAQEELLRREIKKKKFSPIFILSTPRSGSTLLRVMLAGNSKLFSPPELALLPFHTLQERRNAFLGRDAGWLEGVIRALMEIDGLSYHEALHSMQGYEEKNLKVYDFYNILMEKIQPRRLVDKTTLNAFSLQTLERSEYYFDNPFYIFLVRHPKAMIFSYEESRLDQVFGNELPFSIQEKAEIFWVICNNNIQKFLSQIPDQRKYFIRFEDLVNNPRVIMEELCDLLKIDFEPEMLEPYKGNKMVDGVHPASRMVGDPTFLRNTFINPEIAKKWINIPYERGFSYQTRELAAILGYQLDKAQEVPKIIRLDLKKRPRLWVNGFVEFPLTYAQRRLWFLSELTPAIPVYNIPILIHISGNLNIFLLEKSINKIVERHEILRTFFPIKNNEPVQRIARNLTIQLTTIDLSDFTPEERETTSMFLVNEETKKSFKLDQFPLFRIRIIKLEQTSHLVLFNLHHIIFDNWSINIFINEINHFYRSFQVNQNNSEYQNDVLLENLAIQLGDYAIWQQEWLKSEQANCQLEFWKKHLSDSSGTLKLPFDFKRPDKPAMTGSEYSFRINTEIYHKLKSVSQKENMTLFMLLIAALTFLFNKYSGQEDVCFGTPVSGRTRMELENLIGFLSNTLVIRLIFSKHNSLHDLLNATKDEILKTFNNQDIPFGTVVEAINPSRQFGVSPLFNVMIAWQSRPGETIRVSDLSLQPQPVHSGTSKFDITFSFTEEPEGLLCSIEYSLDLFKNITIARIVNHFLFFLETFKENLEKPIELIPILSSKERLNILRLSESYSKKILPKHIKPRVLPLCFKATVELHGDRIAVEDQQKIISYRDLDKISNQIGRWLRKKGVKERDLVVLRLDRSVEMIAVILGVLKAGAAYVPIDLIYPAERQGLIIEDVREAQGGREPLVVTQAGVMGSMVAGCLRVVCVDRDWGEIAECIEDELRVEVKGSDLAYVIYTSGSTGKPKGVKVSHENVVRLMEGTWEWYRFNEDDVWSLFHSYAFDFSVWEMWGALMYGGKLVIVPYEVSRDSERFYELLEQAGVTVLNQTPSAFRALMREEERREGEGKWGRGELKLRYVIFGGEALEVSSLGRWFERHGEEKPRLVNMYGITETTVHVTYREIREADVKRGVGSVIGVPLPDMYVYVLDERMEVVPVGVVGELYVGGGGVSQGYLNREEQTRERFVGDPYQEGKVIYRSGDLGRWNGEGELEYIGRADQQVKVRGYRIELGEIESVLVKHPKVREAVVEVKGGEEKRLVAYVVKKGGEELSGKEVKSWVRERLPEYMVPARVVELEKIPLTGNGKVDRKGLPEGEEEEEEGEELQTVEEEVIAGIWSEVLKIGRVRRKDSFFEKGGHSLIATQMMVRVRGVFGIEMELRSIFETPTLEGFARRVREARQGGRRKRVKLGKRKGGEWIPLSYNQERVWFLEKFQPGEGVYQIPILLRLRGNINIYALNASFRHLIKRHEILRTYIQETEGIPEQIIDETKQFEEFQITEYSRSEERAFFENLRKPFNFENEYLWRALLIWDGVNEARLGIVFHHLVADGWSLGIIIRELNEFYRSEIYGSIVNLGNLDIQYGDFSLWQKNDANQQWLEEGLRWWQDYLRGAELTEILSDRPRPAILPTIGDIVKFRVDDNDLEKLNRLSLSLGITLNMTFMGALFLLLYRFTQQENLVIGTVIANRNEVELEKLIGFFANTLVVRVSFNDTINIKDSLLRVKEEVLKTLTHGDIPFERIVKRVGIERDTSRNPLFGVMYLFQNLPSYEWSNSEITLEPLEIEVSHTPFDINLILQEKNECIEGAIQFNATLYEKETIIRMTKIFKVLLNAIANNFDQRISKISLLTKAEQAIILEDWNRTVYPIPMGKSLIELFQEQVKRTPQRIAVISKYQGKRAELSYAELDKESNNLAKKLIEKGVGRNEIVGLFMPRSVEMLVGLLGILKAGGAYLPLDVSYPKERLEYILQEVKSVQHKKLVIVTSVGLDSQRVDEIGEIVYVNLGEKENAQIDSKATPDCLAYVIYTSGSTGKPKGVMIEHRSVINLWIGLRNRIYGSIEGSGKKVSLNAPLMFDASVQQWVMLLSGETLVITPQENRLDGEALLEWIEAEKIDVLDCVPTQLKFLIEHGLLNESKNWRPEIVLPGGEALDENIWKLLANNTSIEFYNLYGPTECTVDSTICRVKDHPWKVSIGKGITNTRLYVLDRNGEIVPEGIPGELYIGGTGVGRGYLCREDLTSERFLKDPYFENGRMYRTGDLVRWLEGGYLEFLGRIDRQVKLRGFRIELGEIENVLVEHPGVKEAVVILNELKPGEPQLYGYVVLKNKEITVNLRDFLRKKIPEYMIPSKFIYTDLIPRLPNGKVDFVSLNRQATISKQDSKTETPLEGTELLLAQIWQDVLGLAKIGVNDNFFELGGDSIQILQVIAKARKMGFALTPQQIYQNQTIKSLAELTKRVNVEQTGFDYEKVHGKVVFTPIWHWFFEQKLPEPSHWNQSLLLEIKGRLDFSVLNNAVNELINHHDSLRLRFQPQKDNTWEAEYIEKSYDACEYIEITGNSIDDLETIIGQHCEAAHKSINIIFGHLIKVLLFDCVDLDKSFVFIVIHHLVVDIVSWRIFVEDLFLVYEQIRRNEKISLLPKTSSYQLWARRILDVKNLREMEKDKIYWTSIVGNDGNHFLESKNVKNNLEITKSNISLSLSKIKTDQLIHQANIPFGTEVPELLLTALCSVFNKWSNDDMVYLDLEMHGRDAIANIDVSRTIGWFTCIYPIKIKINADKNIGQQIKSVKQQIRAIPNRGLSYGVLRYSGDAKTREILARGKRRLLSFNYLGQIDQLFPKNSTVRLSPINTGNAHSPKGVRPYLIDIIGIIRGGKLHIEFIYNSILFSRTEMKKLCTLMRIELNKIIDYCISYKKVEYSTEDFPHAKITSEEITEIISELDDNNSPLE